jgi:hypothetical protein
MRSLLLVGPERAMSKPMELELVESIWQEIKSELERRKNQIYGEIRSYPPPITACDEQFDHLLAEQRRISRELDRMHAASQASVVNRDPARTIDEFIRSSTCIGDEAEQRIRSLLKLPILEPGK